MDFSPGLLFNNERNTISRLQLFQVSLFSDTEGCIGTWTLTGILLERHFTRREHLSSSNFSNLFHMSFNGLHCVYPRCYTILKCHTPMFALRIFLAIFFFYIIKLAKAMMKSSDGKWIVYKQRMANSRITWIHKRLLILNTPMTDKWEKSERN